MRLAILILDESLPWYERGYRRNLFLGFRETLASSPIVTHRRIAAASLRGLAREGDVKAAVAPGLRDADSLVRAESAATFVEAGGQGEPYLMAFIEGLRSQSGPRRRRCEVALRMTGEQLASAGKPAHWVLPYASWRKAAVGLGLLLLWFVLAWRFPRHRAKTRLGLGFNLVLVAAPAGLLAVAGLRQVASQPWAAPFIPPTLGPLIVPPVVAVGLATAFACLCGAAAACLNKPQAEMVGEELGPDRTEG